MFCAADLRTTCRLKIENTMQEAFDTVIRGGQIVDGTGAAPYAGDIAIHCGKIVRTGSVSGLGREEIDATGLLGTPGFVDLHTHYDALPGRIANPRPAWTAFFSKCVASSSAPAFSRIPHARAA